jgi:hypothetical protein
MIGGLRRVIYTGVLVALTIAVLAGCKASGGGYITSATGEGKATFAFNGKCTNTTFEQDGFVAGVVKGQLQYNDPAADVKFHAELQDFFITGSSTPCEDADSFQDGNVDEFSGTYRVSGGPKEAEGFVDLFVRDAGEPGINGDEVSISLSAFQPGGTYDGYFNSGTVQGGNVQVH